MVRQILLALMVLSCSTLASAQVVGRQFSCNPVDGISTCMQDVLLADDVTMAVLTGASDDVVQRTVEWVTSSGEEEFADFAKFSQRLTAIAFKEGLSLAPRKTALHRRAEVAGKKHFLIPFAQIKTMPAASCGLMTCSDSKKYFKLDAVELQSRVRYSGDGVDICSTTKQNRFCVRLIGVSHGRKLSDQWNAQTIMPSDAFATAQPHFNSFDWQHKTLLGVEVEVLDRIPRAIDGARVITAKPLRFVMFNQGFLGAIRMAAAQTQQAGEK